MRDITEVEKMLLALLSQAQRTFSESELKEVQDLIAAGKHQQAVETLGRLAVAGRHPLPMSARAMVFKLADRLGMDPSSLGLLD